jgi:hypothetical protein
MAQYAPYIQELIPETPLYKPDFNFFDKMLQRKELMFEQGLQKAQTAYSSVLNAPLHNKANIPLRDQYMKNADEELKKLSSADLSLPQNVQAAENIYAPFWKDPYIIKDAEISKWYQNQAQVASSWRDSTDPKIRDQYNPILMQYLNNGLQKLENAERTPESFSKIEKRQAVPFTNIQSYLEDAAGKDPDKLKIVWTNQSSDGPYLIKQENGERSKRNFAIWANSMVGSNFNGQFNVIGTVEVEESVKNIKKRFPNITDQEAIEMLSDDVVGELDKGFKKRKDNIGSEKARINGIFSSLSSIPMLTQEQQAYALKLKDELIKLDGDDKQVDFDYNKFDKATRDQKKNEVISNPIGYFSQLAKQRTVDNWATGRSVIESVKLEKNDAWFAAADLNEKRKQSQLAEKKFEWEQKVDQWNMQYGKPAGKGSTSGGVKVDANGNVIPTSPTPIEEGNVPAGGVYIGLGTTDITGDAVTALDIYHQRMNSLFMSAHNQIFDIKGPLKFLKKEGVTDQEIIQLSSAFKKDIQNPEYSYNAEEGKAANKITKLLLANQAVKNAGIKDVTGPTSLRNAIIAYAGGYISEMSEAEKEGLADLDQEGFSTVFDNYISSVKKLETYTKNEEKRNKLIKDNILSDKKKYGKIIVNRDGKEDIITTDDLVKDVPPFIAPNGKKELTKREVAQAYMSGKVKADVKISDVDGITRIPIYNIEHNGKVYTAVTYKDMDAFKYLESKYGNSESFSKLLRQADESVVPNLPYYQSQTGKMGSEFSYQFDKKLSLQDDKAYRMFQGALSTANAEFYDGDGKLLPAEDIQKIQGFLIDKKENAQTHVGGFTYKTQGVKALPTISFNLTSKPTDKDGVSLGDLTNTTVQLAILPTNTSSDLASLPTSTGMYIYDEILQGKSYKSDGLLATAGFEFEILPTNTDNPNEVKVNLSFKKKVIEKDEKTGNLVLKVVPNIKEEFFNLKGAGAKNPDELVNFLYGLYSDILKENKATNEQYQLYLSNTPSTGAVNTTTYLQNLGVTPKKN